MITKHSEGLLIAILLKK